MFFTNLLDDLRQWSVVPVMPVREKVMREVIVRPAQPEC